MKKLGKLLASCKTEEVIERWVEENPFQSKRKNSSLVEMLSEELSHQIDQRILAGMFWMDRNRFIREEKLKRLLGEN